MNWINKVGVNWFQKRYRQLQHDYRKPNEIQLDWFLRLIQNAKDTEWGEKFNYNLIDSPKTFAKAVPISDYQQLFPYIQRIRKGERNILWPGVIKWFSKSSGTTEQKSKFIPVTSEALKECHFKGGKDMLAFYSYNNPQTKIFSGHSISMGGSLHKNELSKGSHYGDLSAIIIKNLPVWVQAIRSPRKSIALMDDWENKIERMAVATVNKNITSIIGVPSWNLILMKRILEISGKNDITEVWPNLELFIHGGVNFNPYKEQFRKLFSTKNVNYLETYNASEGFFAIQDRNDADDMLLMLDYGIFYEFLPMEELGKSQPQTLTINEVELDKNYVLIISTNAGLWRYMIGDTVRFTSLHPYRIQITGRTRSFINIAGEELIVDNAEKALAIACKKLKIEVLEYTAGPIYYSDSQIAAHEWLMEFENMPLDLNTFVEVLDDALKSLNSDYEAKRNNNMALTKPIVKAVPIGTFYKWLKAKGRLGGQNKIPRLMNNRTVLDEVIEIVAKTDENIR